MDINLKGLITIVDEKNDKNQKNKIKIIENIYEEKPEESIINNELIPENIEEPQMEEFEEETFIDLDEPKVVFDKTKGFYFITTPKRHFFAWENSEISTMLLKDEKTYEVSYVEFVGYYAGKSDVVCVTKGENRLFQTHNDTNTSFVYLPSEDNKKWLWHYRPYNTLGEIYDEFKKKGMVMRNDVYFRENSYRKAVSKLINN